MLLIVQPLGSELLFSATGAGKGVGATFFAAVEQQRRACPFRLGREKNARLLVAFAVLQAKKKRFRRRNALCQMVFGHIFTHISYILVCATDAGALIYALAQTPKPTLGAAGTTPVAGFIIRVRMALLEKVSRAVFVSGRYTK